MKKKKAEEPKVVKIERKPELLSATCFCPKLEKEIAIQFRDLSFSASESECECCGSHGHVEVSFQCECGDFHHVEVNSW